MDTTDRKHFAVSDAASMKQNHRSIQEELVTLPQDDCSRTARLEMKSCLSPRDVVIDDYLDVLGCFNDCAG